MLWEVLILIFIIAWTLNFLNSEMYLIWCKTTRASLRNKNIDVRKKDNSLHFLHTPSATRVTPSLLEKNREVSSSLELARKSLRGIDLSESVSSGEKHTCTKKDERSMNKYVEKPSVNHNDLKNRTNKSCNGQKDQSSRSNNLNKNIDVRKKDNSLHFLHTPSATRVTPSLLEKNREVSSSLELARKSLRGIDLSESVSSGEKHTGTQKDGRSMNKYVERLSVNHNDLKNRTNKSCNGQKDESSRSNNFDTHVKESLPKIKTSVLQSKSTRVDKNINSSNQNGYSNTFLNQGFGEDIIGLLDDDTILLCKTQPAEPKETPQNTTEREFICSQSSANKKLPRGLSTPKRELPSKDKTQLFSTTQTPKEGKTSSALDSLNSPDKNINVSNAPVITSYSPETYPVAKRNGETSNQTQSPGYYSSLYNSAKYKKNVYPGDLKPAHAKNNLNYSGTTKFDLNYNKDCKMDTDDVCNIPAAMDLDSSTNLYVDRFISPMDDEMESPCDMQLNSEMAQDDVLDVELLAKPECLVRKPQKFGTFLFSKCTESKNHFRNEDVMNYDETNNENNAEMIYKHTSSQSFNNSPGNLARSTNAKLNPGKEITPGNQKSYRRKSLSNINQLSVLEQIIVPTNLTERPNLNLHNRPPPQSGKISKPDRSHQRINKSVTTYILSDTKVSVSGQIPPPTGKLQPHISPTKSAQNTLYFNAGIKRVEQPTNVIISPESLDTVTVTEKKKRPGKSEEMELVNDSKLKKIKLSEFPNHLEKRKVKWSQIKKLMNNKVKDAEQKENDYITEMEAHRVEVLGIKCWGCNEKFKSSECTWCPCKHQICLTCFKTVIENFVTTKYQIHLTCPVEACKKIIDNDLIPKQFDSLTIDWIKRKVLKRQERANEEVKEYLFKKISCLNCKTVASMDKKAIHFKCRNCPKEFCSYCHKDWSGCSSQNECRLLNCSGTKCFQELHVPPDNWEESYSALNKVQNELNSVSKTSSVNLNGLEGRAIISLFIQTSADFWITKIIRLQNMKLWEKYVLKRKHMVEEIGVAKINERVLFHGTNENNFSLISEEGFDMRVETANAKLLGKGIYFSTTSKYSQMYSGLSNKMFMVRVLCGYSVQGSASYKRPPKDKSGRMYDSCVNKESGPSIYCLFDNSQCYPDYIIEYEKK